MPKRSRDGRDVSEMRELYLSTALLSRADGSAKFSCGPVSVLASVNGPIEVRMRDELVDRATLEINIRPVSGPPGPAAKTLSDTISRIFIPLLQLHRHPRSLVQLTLQTLALPSLTFSKPFRSFSAQQTGDDNGTDSADENILDADSVTEKAATINAATCALIDSALNMKGLVCAVAIAVTDVHTVADDNINDTEMNAEISSAQIIVDPTAEEERDARCTMCIAFSFGAGQGSTEGQVCLIDLSNGSCSEEELLLAVETSRRAAQFVLAFIRKSQEQRYLAGMSQ